MSSGISELMNEEIKISVDQVSPINNLVLDIIRYPSNAKQILQAIFTDTGIQNYIPLDQVRKYLEKQLKDRVDKPVQLDFDKPSDIGFGFNIEVGAICSVEDKFGVKKLPFHNSVVGGFRYAWRRTGINREVRSRKAPKKQNRVKINKMIFILKRYRHDLGNEEDRGNDNNVGLRAQYYSSTESGVGVITIQNQEDISQTMSDFQDELRLLVSDSSINPAKQIRKKRKRN